ncbi:hypothetical protein ACFX15_037442 [Malus domestica]
MGQRPPPPATPAIEFGPDPSSSFFSPSHCPVMGCEGKLQTPKLIARIKAQRLRSNFSSSHAHHLAFSEILLPHNNLVLGSFQETFVEREIPSGEGIWVSSGSTLTTSGMTNEVSGMQSVLLSSKYLKATQELLNEVVNIGNGMKTELPIKR